MTPQQSPLTPDSDEEINLIYLLTAVLREEAGMTEPDACRISVDVLRGLSKRCGGLRLYCPRTVKTVPVRQTKNRRERDKEIRARFDGRNYLELCQQYGLTERRIRQIVA